MNVQITALHKRYSSGFELGPIDLEVYGGETVGLIGRNGAGKTTLLRLLLGALHPDRGEITFFGDPSLSPSEARAFIGYVDEEPLLYDWMTCGSTEWFFRHFYSTWDSDYFHYLLRRLSVSRKRDYKSLSKGNKAKLWISAALATQPRLLVLDEPTSGLDPVTRRDLLELLREFGTERPSASILFSSHIITDLEVICSRVVMIDEGKILADLKSSDFRKMLPVGSPSTLESSYFRILADREGTCLP